MLASHLRTLPQLSPASLWGGLFVAPDRRDARCTRLLTLPPNRLILNLDLDVLGVASMAPTTHREQVLEMVRTRGVVRAGDVKKAGYDRSTLRDLLREGAIVRDARGLYTLPETHWTLNHSLAVVARRMPEAVICLLSALQFHDIGLEAPWEVWIAIAPHARAPKIDTVPLRVFRPSGACAELGVEVHEIEGVPVRITSPEKTIVDCFKYRSQIGPTVAAEALREAIKDRKVRIGELSRYAEACRMLRVMQPYLDALV